MTKAGIAIGLMAGLMFIGGTAHAQIKAVSYGAKKTKAKPVGLLTHILASTQAGGCTDCAAPPSDCTAQPCGCDSCGCESTCCGSSDGLLPRLWCAMQSSRARMQCYRANCGGCATCSMPTTGCCTEPIGCQKYWAWSSYTCPRTKCRPPLFMALHNQLANRCRGCASSCSSCTSCTSDCTSCSSGSACGGCADAPKSLPKSPFLEKPPEPLGDPPAPPAESTRSPRTGTPLFRPTRSTAGTGQRRLIPASSKPSRYAPSHVGPAIRSLRQSLLKASAATQPNAGNDQDVTLRAQTPRGDVEPAINPFVIAPATGAPQFDIGRKSMEQTVSHQAREDDSAEVKALPALIKFRVPENPLRAQ